MIHIPNDDGFFFLVCLSPSVSLAFIFIKFLIIKVAHVVNKVVKFNECTENTDTQSVTIHFIIHIFSVF